MEKIKFDGIEERLAGMIRIPTVNGSCREYRIDEYKNYLKAQFDTVFDTAAVLPVKDALLCRIRGAEGRQEAYRSCLPAIWMWWRQRIVMAGIIRLFPGLSQRTACGEEEART